ncbi:MAG: hypothetical protein JO061_18325 [Acidobacteriaceae bacterium]|nr:hypothetical protein [Acidobacteriaceae bacterium]
MMVLLLVFLASSASRPALGGAGPPRVEITNGVVHASVYLPNAETGYYRGARFDWSGVIAELTYKGHSFFGVWFPHYDPKLHDAITGPVEEFRSGDTTLGGALGYDQVKPGSTFVKIGVGALLKPDEKPYSFAGEYRIVNPGIWTSRPEHDRISFVQDLHDDAGYCYRYEKSVKLVDHKPELVIDHRLRNIGPKTIETDVYNHDFYVLDGQPTGPGMRIIFKFRPQAADEKTWSRAADLAGKAEIRGNQIVYVKKLEGRESAASLLAGFSEAVSDNDIRVENSNAGIGVREIGDHPLVRLNLWSIRTTVCPEAFIHLRVEPGREVRWRIRYLFYELPK